VGDGVAGAGCAVVEEFEGAAVAGVVVVVDAGAACDEGKILLKILPRMPIVFLWLAIHAKLLTLEVLIVVKFLLR
jgi:hypothetical protein